MPSDQDLHCSLLDKLQWSKLALARQQKTSRFSLGLVKILNLLARRACKIQIVEKSLYFHFQFCKQTFEPLISFRKLSLVSLTCSVR